MLKEFRDFAMRGNVIDMAVGIIIGAAFGTIIKSLVSDVIMPPIGVALGDVDFTNLFITLSGESHATLAAAREAGAATLNYGAFINTVISFVIVAFCVFILIKQMNKMKKKEEEAPAAPAEPSRQELLLEEIRDLLKK
ncbi:MAG: large conductance mechanosensitive channel protein MscL [Proteobacteria bacterium]|nr:large conductance mechanosensitive channel protein MscL [Pseudomonadota bacterium]MDA1354803.1 large conductance mechanosensitive channel protein MscL [Pseudomonadota bacterium]